MYKRLKEIDSGADYLVFYLNKKLYAFFTEPGLMVELNAAECLTDGLVNKRFKETIKVFREKLAGESGISKTVVRKASDEFKPAVSALNLNLTDKCNLNCVYCYAHGGDYDRITDDLSFETFHKTIEAARGVIDHSRPLRFEFFGGEPLLNRKAIEQILTWEKTQDIHEQPIINRISTSLSHLTPRLEDALVSGNFILSVSLDGTRETHDSQRPYKSGGGTFDEIIKNITRMKKRSPQLITVARMTAYKNAGRLYEEIEELRNLNIFDYCSVYSAAMEDDEGGKLYMSDDFRESYLNFASSYNSYLSDEDNIFKGCLELNRYIGHILSGTTALNHCRAGAGYFTLSPDSSVHPCHRLIGNEDLAITNGLAAIETTPAYWQTTVLDRDECSKCKIRYFCGGGCKQENLISTGSPLGVTEKNCEFADLLFEAAIVAVEGLSQNSRERLSAICEKSTDLFVLCGQNIGQTDREKLSKLAEKVFEGYLR